MQSLPRILVVHNHYGTAAPSGESKVVSVESDLLRRRGHRVSQFFRHSDEIREMGFAGAVMGALSTPWNPFAASKLKAKVEVDSPDIVHVHNTFPLLSPSIFSAVGRKAVKVLTLHNYRLFCPAAIPMRKNKVCTLCVERKSVAPSLLYGCYRDSRVATAPLAASVALHRQLGTWSKHVDAFIALTDFQRKLLIKAGLPEALTHVKPNFFPGLPSAMRWGARKSTVVFAGRLTPEKGIHDLLKAWSLMGEAAPELHIIGDGELRHELQSIASKISRRIQFFGQISEDEAQRKIASSRLLVLPSRCFEGFPMVIREAFAFGTPVAVSDLGPLPDIVTHNENGVVFRSGDPASLASEIQAVWSNEKKMIDMSAAARRTFEELYTEELNYRQLLAIYEQAENVHRERALS